MTDTAFVRAIRGPTEKLCAYLVPVSCGQSLDKARLLRKLLKAKDAIDTAIAALQPKSQPPEASPAHH